MTMPVYVIAYGDVFRESFNAIVTVLGTSMFSTAIRLATLLAVISTALYYVKSHDLKTMLHWFILYMAVTVVLLGPKIDIEIIDSANPGSVLNVDNVPFGLAYPASIITALGHALTEAFDEAFHLPDDVSYTKTGMLFGSQLFRLSSGFHLVNPETKNDFDQYVKNCVIGDMLINKKYTLDDLVNAQDIWATISQRPSPIRGVIFHDGVFRTCADATPVLKQTIDNEVSSHALTFFSERIFGGDNSAEAVEKLQQYLPEAYQYYANMSQSASQIMSQNV
ncbi:MAG: hypothetical protein A2298_04100, partial [Gammaproteobacteria bacterium RIFOXYB2_FULL_38_6]